MAHTPGPWAAHQEFANRWRIEAPNPNGPQYVPLSVALACTTILQAGCANADTEANAALIAAAPDLAEHLRSVTRQLDMVKVYISDPECRAVTERKINEALAVLKAAGVEVEG